MTLDLTHPAEQVATLVAGVTDDQLDAPTPCPEMTVGTLLAHLAALAQAFTDAAAKVSGPTTSTPPTAAVPVLPDDWRTVIPARLEALVAAWQQPEAWEGETTAGGVTMPATDIGYVANNELVLHGWDLSAATDQPFEVAEPNLDASWVMVFNTPDDPAARERPVRAAPAGRRGRAAAGSGPGRCRARSVLVAGGLSARYGQRPGSTSHTRVATRRHGAAAPGHGLRCAGTRPQPARADLGPAHRQHARRRTPGGSPASRTPTGSSPEQTSAGRSGRRPAPSSATPVTTVPSGSISRVVAISIDGLNPHAITELGTAGAPTFHRLMREGAYTLDARTEREQTRTLPNHTGMLTGRRIDARRGGHGVTYNTDIGRRRTVHSSAGEYVSSVFDVVHDHGGRTALFATKTKFALYQRTWNTDGGPDRVGADDGRAKIDRFVVDTDDARLVAKPNTYLRASPESSCSCTSPCPTRSATRTGS